MKKSIFFCCFFIAIQLSAQEKFELKTITKNNSRSIGGYGAITNAVTKIANQSFYSLGGYGGVLLNHKILLGGMGKVVFTDNINYQSTFTYFGTYSEYLINPQNVVHLNLGLMGGMGSYSSLEGENSSLVFVAEPKIGVEINIIKFMRVSGNFSYRYVPTNNFSNFKKNDFSGMAAGIGLSFGKF